MRLLRRLRRQYIVLLTIIGLLAIIGAYLYQDTLFELIRSQWSAIAAFYRSHPYAASAIFALLYFLTVTLFLPITIILMLLTGALFGLWPGIVLATVVNTLGSTAAMLLARHFFYRRVYAAYSTQLSRLHGLMRKNGVFYLTLIRMTPLFPAAAVNLMMGLLPMPVRHFLWATLIGSLPLMSFYIWVGTRLSEITRLGDVLSPPMLSMFLGLACILALGRWAGGRLHRKLAHTP